jgi:hypothetical protein
MPALRENGQKWIKEWNSARPAGWRSIGMVAATGDAGKKINGRKRFIVTDTLGLLLVVVVLSAPILPRCIGSYVPPDTRLERGELVLHRLTQAILRDHTPTRDQPTITTAISTLLARLAPDDTAKRAVSRWIE